MKQSILSPRELEVLHLISCELTTGEIANHLCISEHTVISHRKNLLEKTQSRNTAGLMIRAIRRGILSF